MSFTKAVFAIVAILSALSTCLPSDLPETFAQFKEWSSNRTQEATVTKKRFIISHNMTANWHRAERHCVSEKMHLASVRSQKEQDELSELMQKYGVGEAWIGATDQGEEGDFYWVSNGQKLNYTSWSTSSAQPNDNSSSENCVETVEDGFGWWDWDCEDPFHFVCETHELA